MRDIKTNKMKTNLITINMEKTILTLALAFVGTFAMAQQTIQWNHGTTGFTPTGTITVDCDEIFHFTSGGNSHPVIEGGSGNTTVPNFWASLNLTVSTSNNASNPLLVSIPNTGEYYYRCGTNPGNSNLFGHITVAGPTCEGTTSVNEISKNAHVYPNPTNGKLNLVNVKGEINIYDSFGKLIFEKTLTGNVEEVDLSKLPNGLYTIKTVNENFKVLKL